MATKQPLNGDNPWPGLDYYDDEAAAYFHGRKEEIGLLASRMRAEILTVLYGQSGLGKSSLLQAGLFPVLRAQGWLPVYVRLQQAQTEAGSSAASLLEQTRQEIRSVIREAVEKGKIALAAGVTLDQAVPQADESLWRFLHRAGPSLESSDEKRMPISIVIVFDQFEEIFTLGRGSGSESRLKEREDFLRDLADCVQNQVPEELLRVWFQKEAAEEAGVVSAQAAPAFAIDEKRADYRVLITLREDYLADLYDLSSRMRAVRENQMRLLPMDGWKALEAVAKPAKEKDLLDAITARDIVELVAAKRRDHDESKEASAAEASVEYADLVIDPALLSMICRELNNERIARKEAAISPAIVNDLLRTEGLPILRRFYFECFAGLSEADARATGRFIEDHLLTAEGRRDMLPHQNAIDELKRAGIADPRRLINHLVDRRLVRVTEYGPQHLAVVELTHDILLDVVRQEKEKRKAEDLANERNQAALDQAEREKRAAERKAEEERREYDRYRDKVRLRRIIFGLIFVCLVMAAVAFVLKNNADLRERAAGDKERELATRILELDPASVRDQKSRALVFLAQALEENASDRQAAQKISELLLGQQWARPVTKVYRTHDIKAAGFAPGGGGVVAIESADGKTYQCSLLTDEQGTLVAKPLELAPALVDGVAIRAAAFNAKGDQLALVLLPPNGKEAALFIYRWDGEGFVEQGEPLPLPDEFRTITWSPDGQSVLTFPKVLMEPAQRFTLDSQTGRYVPNALPEQAPQAGHREFAFRGITAADFSPDGRWIAVSGPTGLPALLPLGPTAPTVTFKAPGGYQRWVNFLSWSPDGKEFITSGFNDSARIWRVGEAEPGVPLKGVELRDLESLGAPGRITYFPTDPPTIAIGVGRLVFVRETAHPAGDIIVPIVSPDAVAMPYVNADGTRLLTLSGPSRSVMNRLQIWEIPPREPAAVTVDITQPPSSSAPEWLRDLARLLAYNTSADFGRARDLPALQELREKNKTAPSDPLYRAVWDRYLAP